MKQRAWTKGGRRRPSRQGCSTAPQEEDVVHAARAADVPACRAGVSVKEVHDLAREAAIASLFDRVWGSEDLPVMPVKLLLALSTRATTCRRPTTANA